MHYKAPAKKRLYRASVAGVRVSVESMVMANAESIGEIISVAMTESGHYEMLVILPCELVEQKATLELRNPDGESGDNRTQKAHLKILDLPRPTM